MTAFAAVRAERRLLTAFITLAVGVVGAFVGAYFAYPSFWAELLLIVGGSLVAALVAVWGVEELLTWRRQAATRELRAETLNTLRRELEQLARVFLPPSHTEPLDWVLAPDQPPDRDALDGLAAAVLDCADDDHWLGLDHGTGRAMVDAARPLVQMRVAELIQRAFTADVEKSVIEPVTLIEKELRHLDWYVSRVHEADEGGFENARQLMKMHLGTLIETLVTAYRGVVDGWMGVRGPPAV